ncbi:MAG TPA: 2Fe-2S iron-sulfur cluster binding domain-containing protein [Bacteroidetes bacterium]|nr:2Fe-2S iron-sulfur cluster binding domain-containing protein [Bacteroidota bacterium]
MITFILNNQLVQTDELAGTVLLDFIRYKMHLTGTKAGCREGDCGACIVLEGYLENGEVRYKSIVSCLTPLGNVQGRHIVTIEGLQKDKMSPVQQAMINNAATQCGFCTPGFVMSLTAHSLASEKSSPERVISAISGNICRCTGYKSIEHAAENISSVLQRKEEKDPLGWLIKEAFLPEYFRGIAGRLKQLKVENQRGEAGKKVGGGTDLFVQQADALAVADLCFLKADKAQADACAIEIKTDNGICQIGGVVTASDILHKVELQQYFPRLKEYFKLISSEPVRNMGTVAGNIVNASPIADLVIFFLALDAEVHLKTKNGTKRNVPLRKFYTGYKQLVMKPDETILHISFRLPQQASFNFEKVSKRRYLDIASVNSAMLLQLDGDTIQEVHLSAGGVFAWPFYAEKTVAFLKGRTLTPELIKDAAEVLTSEVSPISDIRGSEEYKSLLLRQLFFVHFAEMFPKQFTPDVLFSKMMAP